MGCSDSPVALKVALFFLPLASILDIVGVATPHWSGVSATGASAYFGLWQGCLEVLSESKCSGYDDTPGWVLACRAFAIVAILTTGAATILTALCTCVFSKESHKIAYIIAMIMAFIGAATMILCAVVWAAKNSDLDSSDVTVGWSFGIALGGAILSLIGGIIVTCSLCQN